MWEIEMLPSVDSHQDQQSKPGRPPLPHILPALGVLVILFVAIIFGDNYGSSLEVRYVHALAPLEIPQSRVGSVFNRQFSSSLICCLSLAVQKWKVNLRAISP